MFKSVKRQQGITLIEVIISMSLLLFTLFSAFLLVYAVIDNSSTQGAKIILLSELDKKATKFKSTGVFEDTDVDSEVGTICFYKETIPYDNDPNVSINVLHATNDNYGIFDKVVIIK